MKLGELLDSITVVNHEWLGCGPRVLHIDLRGDGPLRDFEVEEYMIGNDGGGMIIAHGEKKKTEKGGGERNVILRQNQN